MGNESQQHDTNLSLLTDATWTSYSHAPALRGLDSHSETDDLVSPQASLTQVDSGASSTPFANSPASD